MLNNYSPMLNSEKCLKCSKIVFPRAGEKISHSDTLGKCMWGG